MLVIQEMSENLRQYKINWTQVISTS